MDVETEETSDFDENNEATDVPAGFDTVPVGGDAAADGSSDSGGDGTDTSDDGNDGGGSDCIDHPPPGTPTVALGDTAAGDATHPTWLVPTNQSRVYRFEVVPDGFDAVLSVKEACGKYSFNSAGVSAAEIHEAFVDGPQVWIRVTDPSGGLPGKFTLRVTADCTQKCDGRECGPDGCLTGGVCGECEGDLACTADGHCVAWQPACTVTAEATCGQQWMPSVLYPDVASDATTDYGLCGTVSVGSGFAAPELTARFVAPFNGTFRTKTDYYTGAYALTYPSGSACGAASCLAASSNGYYSDSRPIMKAGETFDIVVDVPDVPPNSTGFPLTIECCESQCGSAECGPDACGGSCGDCGATGVCSNGSCVAPQTQCAVTGTFGCGESMTGHLAEATSVNAFKTFECLAGDYPSFEMVYAFKPEMSGTAYGYTNSVNSVVVLAPSSPADSCGDPDLTCVTGSSSGEIAEFPVVAGETYFIVVDGIQPPGAATPYSLVVKCTN